jgi:hypothetical protein
MVYKSHDIVNRHKSEKNTHPDIQDITDIAEVSHDVSRSDVLLSVSRKNSAAILKITYDNLVDNFPSIESHMLYMMDVDGTKTAIAIFEKPIAKTGEGVPLLPKNTKYAVLNAVFISPTEDSVCGFVNPEISIKARKARIDISCACQSIEWSDCTHVNRQGQVVPTCHHITAANRWGVIINHLSDIYPSTFSGYYREFVRRYPQTDIEINESNFNTYIIFIFFVCFVYMVIAHHI